MPAGVFRSLSSIHRHQSACSKQGEKIIVNLLLILLLLLLLSLDYEIDNSYVTGVSIPWSSLETSTISTLSITRTTKRIPTRHPTRYTKSTTSVTTTSTTSTPPTTVPGGEFSEFTEDNNVEAGIEWSGSSTTSSVASVEPSKPEERFKVVCYFTNWAWYRWDGYWITHQYPSIRSVFHLTRNVGNAEQIREKTSLKNHRLGFSRAWRKVESK